MTCPRCNDTGLIEYTGGKHRTYGNTLEPGGHEIEATPENPIYKLCHCKREAPKPAPAGRTYE